MSHVFISYCHEDGDFAENLKNKLEKNGFDVWTDEDRLIAGEDWRSGIDQAISSACALIVIMTPSAKASEYVTYEWAFAWGVGVKVIPVLLKPTPLHPRLEALQYLDFSSRMARPWDRLLTILNELSKPASARQGGGTDMAVIVQNALADLDNVDENIRVQAIRVLALTELPVAHEAVVNALKHPMPDVRAAAAGALRGLKDPTAVPPLTEALRDKNFHVRMMAAWALGGGDREPGGGAAPDPGPARRSLPRALGGRKRPRSARVSGGGAAPNGGPT